VLYEGGPRESVRYRTVTICGSRPSRTGQCGLDKVRYSPSHPVSQRLLPDILHGDSLRQILAFSSPESSYKPAQRAAWSDKVQSTSNVSTIMLLSVLVSAAIFTAGMAFPASSSLLAKRGTGIHLCNCYGGPFGLNPVSVIVVSRHHFKPYTLSHH
jgi:hypothetical protein